MNQVSVEQAMGMALQCHQSGRLPEAEHLYTQVLSAESGHAEALHFLGVLYHQTGRNEKAQELINRSITQNPNYADAYSHLGLVLCAMGRLDQAIIAARRAVVLDKDNASAHYNLGNILREKGILFEAINEFRRATAVRPDWADAQNNLVTALIENGQPEDALRAARAAVGQSPHSPEMHCSLGDALKAGGQFDEAIGAYKQALLLRPGWAQPMNQLGFTLTRKGRYDEAIATLEQLINIDPKHAQAYGNLGITLQQKGRFDDAMTAYRRAVELEPNLAEAHFNLGSLLLLRGDFANGWTEYEWRWRLDRATATWNQSHPRWDGSNLAGKTILLHREQGFGDMIQFIRYAPLVADRGARVLLVCPPEMKSLLGSMVGIDQIFQPGETLPPIDVHCPVLSLPLAFNTTLETIPATIPYLHPDAAGVDKWKRLLAGDSKRRKVGLVWAGRPTHGNDANRSLPLSALSPLGQVDDVSFYSLQKGEAARQAMHPPRGLAVIDLPDRSDDFADTAALIANLDLVITVDTAVAHLCGAVGKPVWVLLPAVPDWRWLLDRDGSPWYPTMRLYRKSIEDENWDRVVVVIAKQLADSH